MNEFAFYTPDRTRKKTQLRVPECHNLYICPPGCGRRAAIRALKNGEQAFRSFLIMTESDAVFGRHTDYITDAVAELLNVLQPVPKAFMLYFNCVDAFLGTDIDALAAELRQRFPDIGFLAVSSDPINRDETTSMGGHLHSQMYEFLQPASERDGGVNLLGHYTSPDPECEFYRVLEHCGVTAVRELHTCGTFAEYRQMECSRLNIALMPMGIYAAEQLRERLGTPFLFCPVSFDIDEVLRLYAEIADLLGGAVPDFSVEVELTREAIRKTVERLNGTPIAVTSSNTMRPFTLAGTLIYYGFNIAAVSVSSVKPEDAEGYARFVRSYPDIEILREKTLESTRLNRRFRELPVYRDEGYYGLHGIRKLMNKLENEVRA